MISFFVKMQKYVLSLVSPDQFLVTKRIKFYVISLQLKISSKPALVNVCVSLQSCCGRSPPCIEVNRRLFENG